MIDDEAEEVPGIEDDGNEDGDFPGRERGSSYRVDLPLTRLCVGRDLLTIGDSCSYGHQLKTLGVSSEWEHAIVGNTCLVHVV